MEFGESSLDPISEHRLWCPYYLSTYRFDKAEGVGQGVDEGVDEGHEGEAWDYVKRMLMTSLDDEEESVRDAQGSGWMNDNLKKARKLMGF